MKHLTLPAIVLSALALSACATAPRAQTSPALCAGFDPASLDGGATVEGAANGNLLTYDRPSIGCPK